MIAKVWWVGLLLAGCGGGRSALTFPVTVSPHPAQASAAAGGSFGLSRADVVIGDLRLESPTPVVWIPAVVPAAYAHPGHDPSGDVDGELLGTFSVDLLAGATLGSMVAWEGEVATGRFELFPAGAAHLAGTYVRADGQEVAFDLRAVVERSVTGLPVEGVLEAESPPAGLILATDLSTVLGFVDWNTPPGDDGVLTVDDGALHNTVPFGWSSTRSWRFSLEGT